MTVAEWQGVPRTLIGYALDHERLKEKDDQAKLLLECIETCCKNTELGIFEPALTNKYSKPLKTKQTKQGLKYSKPLKREKVANKIKLQGKSR